MGMTNNEFGVNFQGEMQIFNSEEKFTRLKLKTINNKITETENKKTKNKITIQMNDPFRTINGYESPKEILNSCCSSNEFFDPRIELENIIKKEEEIIYKELGVRVFDIKDEIEKNKKYDEDNSKDNTLRNMNIRRKTINNLKTNNNFKANEILKERSEYELKIKTLELFKEEKFKFFAHHNYSIHEEYEENHQKIKEIKTIKNKLTIKYKANINKNIYEELFKNINENTKEKNIKLFETHHNDLEQINKIEDYVKLKDIKETELELIIKQTENIFIKELNELNKNKINMFDSKLKDKKINITTNNYKQFLRKEVKEYKFEKTINKINSEKLKQLIKERPNLESKIKLNLNKYKEELEENIFYKINLFEKEYGNETNIDLGAIGLMMDIKREIKREYLSTKEELKKQFLKEKEIEKEFIRKISHKRKKSRYDKGNINHISDSLLSEEVYEIKYRDLTPLINEKEKKEKIKIKFNQEIETLNDAKERIIFLDLENKLENEIINTILRNNITPEIRTEIKKYQSSKQEYLHKQFKEKQITLRVKTSFSDNQTETKDNNNSENYNFDCLSAKGQFFKEGLTMMNNSSSNTIEALIGNKLIGRAITFSTTEKELVIAGFSGSKEVKIINNWKEEFWNYIKEYAKAEGYEKIIINANPQGNVTLPKTQYNHEFTNFIVENHSKLNKTNYTYDHPDIKGVNKNKPKIFELTEEYKKNLENLRQIEIKRDKDLKGYFFEEGIHRTKKLAIKSKIEHPEEITTKELYNQRIKKKGWGYFVELKF